MILTNQTRNSFGSRQTPTDASKAVYHRPCLTKSTRAMTVLARVVVLTLALRKKVDKKAGALLILFILPFLSTTLGSINPM